jgi:uncharacterized protein with NAD-binding domain and iron-sulfur cluster
MYRGLDALVALPATRFRRLEYTGLMEGAIRSGQRAADRILTRFALVAADASIERTRA